MIVVIRISGMVDVPRDIEESLSRIRLRRKYSAVILEDSVVNRKLLVKIRDYIAYGVIDEKTLEKLVELRAEPTKKGQKIDVKKAVAGAGMNKLLEVGVKPFFRLHPPRGGIESKKHFGVGKGVLGDNKEKINELVGRML